MSKEQLRWIVGISGASGTLYARALLRALNTYRSDIQIELVLSDGALRVLQEEDGIEFGNRAETVKKLIGTEAPQVTLHNSKDTGACIASGSYKTAGMVIVPCSMNTLASIAHGLSDNLLRRAADVILKEGRPLIIVPRETPLSLIHLRNLTTLAEMGVKIFPAMPGFYSKPQSIEELVNHFVMRLLDQMGIDLPLSKRWKSE